MAARHVKATRDSATMDTAPPAVLGEPISDNPLTEQLHRATVANRPRRIRRCLARGCPVDAANASGQTALFAAAFSARQAAVAELLRRGADPNARCDGGYTAVHAACYAGRRQPLRRLLQSGGDLRLQDLAGRRPADWARLQHDPLRRRRVLQLIEKARLAAMTSSGGEALLERSSSFSAGGGVRAALRRLLPGEQPRAAADVDLAELTRSVQSVGFGAVYYGGGTEAAGALALLPLVTERSLEPDTASRGYPLGGGTEMAARRYLGAPVSVRRLVERPPAGATRDLLITELEATRRLHHPDLLLLMAVCPSENLDGLALVFERVSLGSLHHCRYRRGLHMSPRDTADVLLQVCSALQFVHAAGWLHCAVTSHAVQLLTTSRAKLGCMEHALRVRPGEPARPQRRLLACRADGVLYNWLAPEVLSDGIPSRAADVYSFCALTWEMAHGRPPWDGLSADQIAERVGAGHALPLKSDACPQLLRDFLRVGLRAEPQQRDLQLEEARFMLASYRDGQLDQAPTGEQTRRGRKPPAPPPPPAPALLHPHQPPVRLSRTLSPDLLSRPCDAPPLVGLEEPDWSKRPAQTASEPPRPAASRADPPVRRAGVRRRSATWQSADVEWREETAIKPASHRVTRHGSACSLSGRRAAGGAPPWPPAPHSAESGRRHSRSLEAQVCGGPAATTPPSAPCPTGLSSHAPCARQLATSPLGQAPRKPRFSPSPSSSASLTQLMAELDMCDLLPAYSPGPRPSPASWAGSPAPPGSRAGPQVPSVCRTRPRIPPPARAEQTLLPAAARELPKVLPDYPTEPVLQVPALPPAGSSQGHRPATARTDAGHAPDSPIRSFRPASPPAKVGPLVSDCRGVSRMVRPAHLPLCAAGAVRWHRREAQVRPAAAAAVVSGQTTEELGSSRPRARPTVGRAALCSGQGRSTHSTEGQGQSGTVTEARSQSSASTDGQTLSSASTNRKGLSSTSTNMQVLSSTSSVPPELNSAIGNGPIAETSSCNGPPLNSTSGDGRALQKAASRGRAQSSTATNGEDRSKTVGDGQTRSSTDITGQTELSTGSTGHEVSGVTGTCAVHSQSPMASNEERMSAHSRSNFAARREFFSGQSGGVIVNSQSESTLRLPRRLNSALLLRRTMPPPAATVPNFLLTQPRPFRLRSAGVTYPSFRRSLCAGATVPATTSTPERPAASPSTSGSCHRHNVTFQAHVLELPADGDGEQYYDDDLASPDVEQAHLQLLPVHQSPSPSPPPVRQSPPPPPPPPPPLLRQQPCLDDGGRASPLSMELPSSSGESQDELSDSETSCELLAGSPLVASSEATRSDGSRVRLFQVACDRGFRTCVQTRAGVDGRCTVTCTSTDLADGSAEVRRRTVVADQVHTQVVVADR